MFKEFKDFAIKGNVMGWEYAFVPNGQANQSLETIRGGCPEPITNAGLWLL
jgi:hypothetical protein